MDPQGAHHRWPLALWIGQLAIPLLLLGFSVARELRGSNPGVLIRSGGLAAVLWIAVVLAVVSMARGRRWIERRRYHLSLLMVMSAASLAIIGEAAVRAIGTKDQDGNFFVRGHHLHPYRLPVKRIQAAVSAYRRATTTVLQDDPQLGWCPRPGSANALESYNADGVRVAFIGRTYAERPTPGTLRILTLGDSFTKGAEVAYDETWGALLEAGLAARGVRSEVINLGVAGYGIDQAFLRWKRISSRFSPHLVIFGLQLENLRRNVNLIRPLYSRLADIPFAKPRFLLSNDVLSLVNIPTVAPEKVAATVEHIDTWPLVKYEAYYNAADFKARPWHASRFLSFVEGLAREGADDNLEFDASSTESRLGLAILDQFKTSVNATGAAFVLVHLPRRPELRFLRRRGTLPNGDFLRTIENRFDLVETARALVNDASNASIQALFTPNAHYSPRGNVVVSQVLVPELERRASRANPPNVSPGVR